MVDRLRPHVDTGPPPEPLVSADRIRMFLFRWMIETGDPIDVVAQGFDVDVELASGVAEGRVHSLTSDERNSLEAKLGLERSDLLRQTGRPAS